AVFSMRIPPPPLLSTRNYQLSTIQLLTPSQPRPQKHHSSLRMPAVGRRQRRGRSIERPLPAQRDRAPRRFGHLAIIAEAQRLHPPQELLRSGGVQKVVAAIHVFNPGPRLVPVP